MASDCSDSQHRCPLPPEALAAGDEIAVPHQKRDPEIHQDVRAELATQQDDGRRSVEITVHQGVVYLTGMVESYAQKWAIDRAVRRIIGVKGLRDYLHVRPPEGAAPDDRRIQRTANSRSTLGRAGAEGNSGRREERRAATEAVRSNGSGSGRPPRKPCAT